SAYLQARAAVEDDHHIFAQRPGLLLLPLAQPFAGRHHQHDRHNPPGDAKHREERAQLVRPQGAHDIDNEVPQGHRASLMIGRDTATNVSLPRRFRLTCLRYESLEGFVAENLAMSGGVSGALCGISSSSRNCIRGPSVFTRAKIYLSPS